MLIVCSHCFANNRIPENKDYLAGKCGRCQQPIYSQKVIELTDDNFYHYVEKNDLPVVVDFWASWCGPCKVMAPVFSQVASQSPNLLFAKVNTEVAQKVASQAAIRSIPTLMMFRRGREMDRVSGALNAMQLKQWILQALQK